MLSSSKDVEGYYTFLNPGLFEHFNLLLQKEEPGSILVVEIRVALQVCFLETGAVYILLGRTVTFDQKGLVYCLNWYQTHLC